MKRNQRKRLIEARIQHAVNGIQIPLLLIPKLYKMAEEKIATGCTDGELHTAIAEFVQYATH